MHNMHVCVHELHVGVWYNTCTTIVSMIHVYITCKSIYVATYIIIAFLLLTTVTSVLLILNLPNIRECLLLLHK